MTYNGKAAYAAGNCQSNDIEDTDDMTDFLSEKVVSIVRILIPDEGIRAVVLADAFAKCYVDDLYTGDVFEDIEDAKDMVGELVAGHIIDNDPMLCSDFGSCLDDDESDVEEDCPEDVCDGPFCDGDCGRCIQRRHAQVRLRRRHGQEDLRQEGSRCLTGTSSSRPPGRGVPNRRRAGCSLHPE